MLTLDAPLILDKRCPQCDGGSDPDAMCGECWARIIERD